MSTSSANRTNELIIFNPETEPEIGDLVLLLQTNDYYKVSLINYMSFSNMLLNSLTINLKILILRGCDVSDLYLNEISSNLNLQEIDLSFTKVSVVSLCHFIENSNNLKFVDFSFTTGEKDLKNLSLVQKDYKNKVKFINLQNTIANDDLLVFISKHCPDLLYLNIDSCHLITNKGVNSILNKCTKLLKFDCSFCSLLTDKCLSSLIDGKLHFINVLSFVGCDFGPETMLLIAQVCSQSLSLLILDGCERILSSFVSNYQYNRESEFECILDYDSLREFIKHDGAVYVTNNNNENNHSIIDINDLENISCIKSFENNQILTSVESRNARRDKIVEKKRCSNLTKSKSTRNFKSSSRLDLSLNNKFSRLEIIPEEVEEPFENLLNEELSWNREPINKNYEFGRFENVKSLYTPPQSPKKNADVDAILLASGRINMESKNEISDNKILIASGRHLKNTSTIKPFFNLNAPTWNNNNNNGWGEVANKTNVNGWGKTPELWNSKQSTQISMKNTLKFPINATISKSSSYADLKTTNIAKNPWTNNITKPTKQDSEINMKPSNKSDSTSPINTNNIVPKSFVYSLINRGKLLIKLKIEIKNGHFEYLHLHQVIYNNFRMTILNFYLKNFVSIIISNSL